MFVGSLVVGLGVPVGAGLPINIEGGADVGKDSLAYEGKAQGNLYHLQSGAFVVGISAPSEYQGVLDGIDLVFYQIGNVFGAIIKLETEGRCDAVFVGGFKGDEFGDGKAEMGNGEGVSGFDVIHDVVSALGPGFEGGYEVVFGDEEEV